MNTRVVFYILVAVLAITTTNIIAYNIGKNNRSDDAQVIVRIPSLPSSTSITSPNDIQPSLHPTVYTSRRLGVSFSYLDDLPPRHVNVEELGNRVYLYTDGDKPESGKYVEVLSKDPKDSLERSLQKRYLTSQSGKNCKVTGAPLAQDYFPPTMPYLTATIWASNARAGDVPFGTGDDPFGSAAEQLKCLHIDRPAGGVIYFLVDSKHPTKLLLFVLGQDNFPSKDRTWDATIQFID
jgi:hypothetical protein